MKRDMDLVREMLLAIEAGGCSFKNADALDISNWPKDMIEHHLSILSDANFVTRDMISVYTGRGVILDKRSEYPGSYRMTWEGHDFLETVRDPEIWKRTKEGASKMGGWTAGLLKDIGKAYLKHVAKERLGFDL